MARPRSLAGITSLVTGGDGMPPNSSALASPSPTIAALQVAAGPPAATLAPAGTGESSPLYSGAKVQDASLLKLLRGHCLRIRHRLRSAASGGVNGSAGMYSVALLLLLALWALYARTAAYAAAPRHLVVLDAGSTGTRAHVFTYAATTRSSSYAAMQLPEPKLKTSPGLSSFAREPAGAVASLAPLLQFAASHVPPHLRSSTPVLLMATAGLRLLPDTEAQALLNACRGVLAASGFAFRREWASIISGADEGLFAWVAANYASGALQVGRYTCWRPHVCVLVHTVWVCLFVPTQQQQQQHLCAICSCLAAFPPPRPPPLPRVRNRLHEPHPMNPCHLCDCAHVHK